MSIYLRGLSVFFADPRWAETLLVGSLALATTVVVPLVGNVLLAGCMIVRRAALGDAGPIPPLGFDFDRLFDLLLPGLKATLVQLLWLLPAVIVGTSVMGCLGFSFLLGIAQAFIAQLEAGGDLWAAAPTLVLWMLAVWITVPLFGLFVSLAGMPAFMAAVRVEVTDDWEQGLRFGEVMQMTQLVWRELVVATLLFTVLGWVSATAALFTGGVAFAPLGVLVVVVRAWLGGSLYRRCVERGAEALPIAPIR